MGMCSEWYHTTREIGVWRNEPAFVSCHVSIRQSLSCVMPSWRHAKSLLVFILYLRMCIQANTTFENVYWPLSLGWPYEGIARWCMLLCLALNYIHAPPTRAVTAILPRQNLRHDPEQGQLNYRKDMNSDKIWINEKLANQVRTSPVKIHLMIESSLLYMARAPAF